uniref:Uncharacterized protein n=1 Tax=Anguilla anguilla TaxID=7936 RepID=A0A0E9PY44_ANGAN
MHKQDGKNNLQKQHFFTWCACGRFLVRLCYRDELEMLSCI